MACIAMEYVNGGTLSQLRLKEPKRVFEPEQILPWIEQACTALHYAHTVAKVAHRDLKPSNMMIDESGRVKLTDFGIARSLSDSVSRVSNRPNSSGTLPFMSPQQLYGEKPSALDDVYAMGATIYELLTGKPPFYSGCVERQITDRIPATMAERRAELEVDGEPIPLHWERVVAACLAKSREDRPQSMVELATGLGNPAWEGAVASPPIPGAAPAASPANAGLPPGLVPPLPTLRPESQSSCVYIPPPPAHRAIPSRSRILWLGLACAFFLGMLAIAGGVWIVLKAWKTAVPIVHVNEGTASQKPLAVEDLPPASPQEPSRIPEPQPVPDPIPQPPPRMEPQRVAAVLPIASTTCQGAFTYHDPERTHRTNFTLTFAEVSPPEPATGRVKIAGTMAEPRVDFGPTGVKTLTSSFTGTWTPTSDGARIAFAKIYRFDGHPTDYIGTYDAATKTVTGTWNLNGYSGDFTLTGVVTQ
jgi:hypothetical protein